jgi:hypothetical protein
MLLTTLLLSACAPSDRRDAPRPPRAEEPAAAPETKAAPMPTTPAAPIDKRTDLDLKEGQPTRVDALGLTITLVSAERLQIEHKGGIGHQDRVVVRFEAAGQPPQEVTFGPGERVKQLYGHAMAVFGGTTLSIFPPGQPAMP